MEIDIKKIYTYALSTYCMADDGKACLIYVDVLFFH